MPTRMIDNKFQLPKCYEGSGPSIWNQFSELSLKYQPIQMGSGFSDYPVPKYMTDTLAAVATDSDNLLHQYSRVLGHSRLVNALSATYSQLIERTIDPLTEIIVTVGAYEALYASIRGHIDEGDEVIIIEPFFDCYDRMVKMAGGIPRYIPLRLVQTPGGSIIHSRDYALDDTELENLFNDKTKMIILNTPNNPLGKMFNREELTKIADLCKKYNVVCVSDEVYEWMVYDNQNHIRICTLPGMWERTITIGSVGKTFSLTGWKCGWTIGPANLLMNLQIIHQTVVCQVPTVIQEAAAILFEKELERIESPKCYFNVLPKELQAKRDLMVQCMTSIGFKVIVPQGGCFMLVDWSKFEHRTNLSSEVDPEKDFRFSKWLIKNVGIMGIPPSVFCSEANKKSFESYIRFCFFKKNENLEKATAILKKWVSE